MIVRSVVIWYIMRENYDAPSTRNPAFSSPASCRQTWIAELREQVAGLEEDNRVLVEAAGLEICDQSEV